MKKMYKILFILIIILCLGALGIYNLFFNLQTLPKGELISKSESSNGEYVIKIYLVNGGATVDWAIRGELNFREMFRKSRTIYWNYHEKTAQVKWLDKDTVSINGHILNVLKDTYDWRRE